MYKLIHNSSNMYRVKDGRVVESGSHEELIKQGEDGVYYEMWQKQLHDDNDNEINGGLQANGNGNGNGLTGSDSPAPVVPEGTPTSFVPPTVPQIDTSRSRATTEQSDNSGAMVSSPTELEDNNQQEQEQEQEQSGTATPENQEEDEEEQPTTSNVQSPPKNKKKKKRSKSRKGTTF